MFFVHSQTEYKSKNKSSKFSSILMYRQVGALGFLMRGYVAKRLQSLQLQQLELYSQMTDNLKSAATMHTFSLVRLKPECKVPPTVVDFTPPLAHSPLDKSCTPCFNPDRSHRTPSFILLTDTKTQERELESDRIHFEERLKEVGSEQEEVVSSSGAGLVEAAIPSSNYCQICREHFRSYEEHVEQKNHILRWHHNEFNQDILHTCQALASHTPPNSPPHKTKPIGKAPKLQKATSVKYSPKTRVQYESKRRMSISLNEGLLGMEPRQGSFNLGGD